MLKRDAKRMATHAAKEIAIAAIAMALQPGGSQSVIYATRTGATQEVANAEIARILNALTNRIRTHS